MGFSCRASLSNCLSAKTTPHAPGCIDSFRSIERFSLQRSHNFSNRHLWAYTAPDPTLEIRLFTLGTSSPTALDKFGLQQPPTGDSRPMRPASALRPSSVSRVLNARRVCRRCLSQQANRSVAQLLQWRPTEKADDVVINGFVRSVRSMKAHRFVALGDGSSLAPLQALVQADYAEGCGESISTHMSQLPTPLTDDLSAV